MGLDNTAQLLHGDRHQQDVTFAGLSHIGCDPKGWRKRDIGQFRRILTCLGHMCRSRWITGPKRHVSAIARKCNAKSRSKSTCANDRYGHAFAPFLPLPNNAGCELSNGHLGRAERR